jgi:hypothetical protein
MLSNLEFVVALYSSLGFATVFGSLEADRSNWDRFEKRFTRTTKKQNVWGHFDGSTLKPSKPETVGEEGNAYEKKLAAWQTNEELARFILTTKLPSEVFVKYGDIPNPLLN